MSGDLVEKLTAASQYGMCDGYWPKDEPEAPFQLYAEAAAELARFRSEVEYWQKDSATAWDKCEQRRLENAELARLGSQMSNVLFNLEQSDSQHPRDRRTMKELTKAWDALLSRVSGGGK